MRLYYHYQIRNRQTELNISFYPEFLKMSIRTKSRLTWKNVIYHPHMSSKVDEKEGFQQRLVYHHLLLHCWKMENLSNANCGGKSNETRNLCTNVKPVRIANRGYDNLIRMNRTRSAPAVH
jgi:RecG-like helicase